MPLPAKQAVGQSGMTIAEVLVAVIIVGLVAGLMLTRVAAVSGGLVAAAMRSSRRRSSPGPTR